jgi:tRNA-specific 2-thiouridylase
MGKILAKKGGRKVFVGLSGGVDSSVSAALLKSQGYDVHGVFIKVWQPDFYKCDWRKDRLDAMRVCAKLGIPFYTLNLEKEYKKEVVDYMISEYQKGRTPNPDVMCNKHVKFGGFFDWAMKKGADFVATGHYAEVKFNKKTKIHEMLAGKDDNKDQSYFLWTLNQKQLAKTIFPVGHLAKPAVRKLAKKYGLSTFEKKDSQGLCFIGKVDMADFLGHFIESKSGAVLNVRGEIIGHHNGAELFTIGQRHGFTLTKTSPDNIRMFVVAKDLAKNTISVSDDVRDLSKDSQKIVSITNVNWQSDSVPKLSKKYSARIRYRQKLAPCKIKVLNNNGVQEVIVEFSQSQKSVTSGQSVVIYDGRVCLGGGIII